MNDPKYVELTVFLSLAMQPTCTTVAVIMGGRPTRSGSAMFLYDHAVYGYLAYTDYIPLHRHEINAALEAIGYTANLEQPDNDLRWTKSRVPPASTWYQKSVVANEWMREMKGMVKC